MNDLHDKLTSMPESAQLRFVYDAWKRERAFCLRSYTGDARRKKIEENAVIDDWFKRMGHVRKVEI